MRENEHKKTDLVPYPNNSDFGFPGQRFCDINIHMAPKSIKVMKIKVNFYG